MSDLKVGPLPKYLSIYNGYITYGLLGDDLHDKTATTQRIPLGEWTHLEWSVVDGTIRTYVNGIQTDLTHGPHVKWGSSDSKLHIFSSSRYTPGEYTVDALYDEIQIEVGPNRMHTRAPIRSTVLNVAKGDDAAAAVTLPNWIATVLGPEQYPPDITEWHLLYRGNHKQRQHQ